MHTQIPSKNQEAHWLEARGFQEACKFEACPSHTVIKLTISMVAVKNTKWVLPLTRLLTLEKSFNPSKSLVSPSVNSDDYNSDKGYCRD